MLNNIDLTKIRVFKEVFLNLNIHRASENLHITPSAVSQSLKNLESDLGKQLFVRSKQRILPTELAKDFFERIIPIYQSLIGELADFMYDPGDLSRTIRVGAPIVFGKDFLINHISEWEREKNFKVDLYLAESSTLIQKLKRGELDYFFAEKDIPVKGITSGVRRRKIIDDALTLAAGPKLIESLSGVFKFKELIRMPHIMQESSTDLLDCYYAAFKKKPITLLTKLVTEDNEALLQAALENLGIGVFYYSQINHYLKKGKLVDLLEGRRVLRKSLDLFQLDNFHPNNMHFEFIESFLENIQ